MTSKDSEDLEKSLCVRNTVRNHFWTLLFWPHFMHSKKKMIHECSHLFYGKIHLKWTEAKWSHKLKTQLLFGKHGHCVLHTNEEGLSRLLLTHISVIQCWTVYWSYFNVFWPTEDIWKSKKSNKAAQQDCWAARVVSDKNRAISLSQNSSSWSLQFPDVYRQLIKGKRGNTSWW